jgi:ferric-dicitrate binding protein FerR (iron transport regulator)
VSVGTGVFSAQRHMRLAFQPLTRRWRLNIASGLITNAGLGMALNQNFDNLQDALAAIQRISRWDIAEASEINLDERHVVDFRFRLDLQQLPRPLQIGSLGQADWAIAAAIRRPLDLESIK